MLRSRTGAVFCASLLFAFAPATAARAAGVGIDLPKSAVELRAAVKLASRDLRKRGIAIALKDGSAESLGKAGFHVAVGPAQSTVAANELPAFAAYGISALTPSAGAPSFTDPVLFHLTASDRQLIAAAYKRMTAIYGSNLCILDDGTPLGRARANLMVGHATNPQHLTVTPRARNPIVASCITSVDAVFLATDRYMLFAGSRVANRLSIVHLLDQTFRRDFDLTRIGSRYGAVYEPIASPIVRTGRALAVAQAYRAYTGTDASDDALRAYAATEIAAAVAAKGDGARSAIAATNFSTAIGRVAFDAFGDRLGAPITIRKL